MYCLTHIPHLCAFSHLLLCKTVLPYSLGLELIITFRSCSTLGQGLWWCPAVLGAVQVQKKKQSLLRRVSIALINTGISCNALWHHLINCCTDFQNWNTPENCICFILWFKYKFYLHSECISYGAEGKAEADTGRCLPVCGGWILKWATEVVPSHSSGIVGQVVEHHSKIPTWASCHKLRNIAGEGLGWHICTLRTRRAIHISVTGIYLLWTWDPALLLCVGHPQSESIYEIY